MKVLSIKRLLFLLLMLGFTFLSAMTKKTLVDEVDDWEYNATSVMEDSSRRMATQGSIKMSQSMPMAMHVPAPMKSKNIGLSVGGAKDTNNFKANIDNGYLPKLDSITYEGQFYNHYFDTGIGSGECKDLFCPSYSSAKRFNQFSEDEEYFLSVGLNSGIKEGDFKRKKLNLVVVLDISGSMSSKFNAYHYDKAGTKVKHDEKEHKTKMEIANESIVAMLSQLKDDDKVGIVLFDHNAYKAKALRLVGKTDKEAIRDHILGLKSRGGTNWSAGYKEGLALFDELTLDSEYENRIVFLTDAMPNRGELKKDKLFGMAKKASKKGIHTTFIGIGVDFNNDLVEYVSKTKGANYFSVHSSKEFSKLLEKEFEYMVTPLVYDLELKLSNSVYSIEAVYGSPNADMATGEIMKINTLFPSHNDGTATKGGVVLIKLHKHSKKASTEDIKLQVSYEDINGNVHKNSQTVNFKSKKDYYDNKGIRKAILVSDYVSFMKNWLIDARKGCNDSVAYARKQPIEALKQRCMIYPPLNPDYVRVKTWERKSCKLELSLGYRKLFTIFRKHYMDEMKRLNDASLEKEFNILNSLINSVRESKYKPKPGERVDDWMYRK